MIPKRHANFSLANCASLCSIYLFMICIPRKGQDACVDGVCDVLFILIVYSSHVLNHKLPKLKSGFYRSIGLDLLLMVILSLFYIMAMV